ncbi:MAG: YDG/SRA domain-containing protein [Pyrinomonadaceae bacterium]
MSSRRSSFSIPDIKKVDELLPGQTITWAEVARIHPIRNGIHHRGGRLVSLLTDFGRINPCYPDRGADDRTTIVYTGSGRRGDQRLDAANRALLDAVETGHSVPLFNKLAVGRWEYVGRYRVAHGEYVFDDTRERMVWRFTLHRAES